MIARQSFLCFFYYNTNVFLDFLTLSKHEGTKSIVITAGSYGHVCSRERAENYMLTYNQAFICQERYTTSCGHLDWRRCTRYRVQTCYTPQQKYATRYKQVEECCPGWREDGSGACLIPVCSQLCRNGGSCVESGGPPTCKCQDGYSGEACEYDEDGWKGWYTAALVSAITALLIIVALIFGCRRKHILRTKRNSNVRVGIVDTSMSRSRHNDGIFYTSSDQDNIRWAVPRNQITPSTTVYPSAPPHQQ